MTASLAGGTNYGDKTDYTTTGALTSGVDDLISGYELFANTEEVEVDFIICLLYTSPSPRDLSTSRMPSSA